MAGVFISYRRGDTSGEAGRVADWLRNTFGKDRVFMDVTGIEPGLDFVEAINKAVNTANVLLVVIGPEWLGPLPGTDKNRIDDPKDFVRIEVASALRRRIRVVPLLVCDADLPKPSALPEDLQPLLTRNALELRDTQWEAGMDHLIRTLEPVLGRRRSPSRAGEAERPKRAAALSWPAAAVAVLGLLAMLNAIRVGFQVGGGSTETLLERAFGSAQVYDGSESLLRVARGFGAAQTIGLLVGGLLAILLALRTKPRELGTVGVGLLCGFALAGTIRFGGMLSWAEGAGSRFTLALIGALVVLVVGGVAAWQEYRALNSEATPFGFLRAVALLGGLTSFIALFLDYNGVTSRSAFEARGEAWDLVVLPLVTVALLFVPRLPRPLAGGFLVAFGTTSALVWLRFIAVPALQDADAASLGDYGALIGAAGAVLVALAGRQLALGSVRHVATRREAIPAGRG